MKEQELTDSIIVKTFYQIPFAPVKNLYVTITKTELLYPKNWGAYIAIEEKKILEAILGY